MLYLDTTPLLIWWYLVILQGDWFALPWSHKVSPPIYFRTYALFSGEDLRLYFRVECSNLILLLTREKPRSRGCKGTAAPVRCSTLNLPHSLDYCTLGFPTAWRQIGIKCPSSIFQNPVASSLSIMRLPNPLQVAMALSTFTLDAPSTTEVGLALHPNGVIGKCLDVQNGVFKNGTPVQM